MDACIYRNSLALSVLTITGDKADHASILPMSTIVRSYWLVSTKNQAVFGPSTVHVVQPDHTSASTKLCASKYWNCREKQITYKRKMLLNWGYVNGLNRTLRVLKCRLHWDISANFIVTDKQLHAWIDSCIQTQQQSHRINSEETAKSATGVMGSCYYLIEHLQQFTDKLVGVGGQTILWSMNICSYNQVWRLHAADQWTILQAVVV